MKRSISHWILTIAGACAVATACHSPQTEQPSPSAPPVEAELAPSHPDPAPFPAADSWRGIMEHVIAPWSDDTLPDALYESTPIDFARIARETRVVADHFALGYGAHAREDGPEDGPDFATLSRDAEAWAREIVRLADARDAGLEAVIQGGFGQHCDRCHDQFQ